MPARQTVLSSALLAAVLAVVYLAVSPPSQDLAAATFRADLFADHGFLIFNDQWYSGHYLLSYSVLFPPLAALLGPELVGALSAVAAAALFAAYATRRFGATPALVASLWFAIGVAAWLLTGRLPFLLAVPFGLAAILALDRDRVRAGAGLAVLCSLASPVAGLFLGLAAAAIALAGDWRRGIWLGLGALAPVLALNLLFPTGGEESFVFSAFVAIPALALAGLALVGREHRALRIGLALYAVAAIAVFVAANPLGGNVTRLGALLAGPVAALVLWPRGRLVVLAVCLPLAYWQLNVPVRDYVKGAGDPSSQRAYFEPLISELDRLAGADPAVRVQVPPTRNRWEAAYLAPEYPIARGWLRQLESDDFDLFTDGELDPAAYRDWLGRHGVSYVAVAAAELDYLAEDEVALIDSGLDYLEPVWESGDWRLYRVEGAEPPAIVAAGPDSFELDAPRPGAYPMSLNASRYWRVVSGDACARDEDGELVVEAHSPGPIRIESRLLGDGRC